jgi:hypothetical protein
MSFSKLSPAVLAALRAIGNHDRSALLASFTGAGVVVERGEEYRDADLGNWADRICSDDGSNVTPISVVRRGDRTIVAVVVRRVRAGVPPAQFDWTFTGSDGHISQLVIAPTTAPTLPSPVGTFVSAVNTFDLDALMTTFAEGAVVNDQLREYRGRSAVKDWASRDLMRNRVTMYVVETVQNQNNMVVTANVDGDYDKRGLPDPLVLTFYFSVSHDKINQLIILRNEADV